MNTKIYKDHKGNIYSTQKEMCNAYSINLTTFISRINCGMSLEEALTNNLQKKPPLCNKECKDHKGNIYKSFKNMCEAYDISPAAVRSRLKYKWSLKDALTTPSNKALNNPLRKECFDHLGNKYRSQTEMCKHYGITASTFSGRLKRGYSIEEALTAKPWNHKVSDHLGNIYDSTENMAKTYGKTDHLIEQRLRQGWSLEEALTIPVTNSKNKNDYSPISKKKYKCYDHEGNEYRNKNEIAKHYSFQDWGVIKSRLENGMDLKTALTTPPGKNSSLWIECCDHKGNRYSNLKEMCDKYGITFHTFRRREKMGWALKEILTTPVVRKINLIDYNGKHYEKLTEFLAEYNLKMSDYYGRKKRGMDA